jgi:hypothetical protein
MPSRSPSRAGSTSARLAALTLLVALAVLGARPAAAVEIAARSAVALPHVTPLEAAARYDVAGTDAGADAENATAAWSRLADATDDAPPAAAPPPAKATGKRKSLLYSLLLPGAGELSLGARGRAAGFFVAEGLIWTHYVWFEVAGHLRRDDYVEQAQLNAGVGVSSADDSYWRLIGLYDRSSGSGPGSYEEVVRRDARDNFPDDPAAQDAYVASHLPSGDKAWSWSSPTLQQSYRTTRASSNRAFDRAKYSFAAAILNRLASAVDTQILHRRLAKDGQAARLDEGTRLLADATPGGGTRLLLVRRF